MKTKQIAIVGIFVLLFGQYVVSQDLPPDVCELHKGKLVFNIDLRWNEAQRQLLVRQYDLDSVMVAELYKGKRNFTVQDEQWEAVPSGRYHVTLRKPVKRNFSFFELLFALISRQPYNFDIPGQVNEPVMFGLNKFDGRAVEVLDSGKVRFTLHDYPYADEVCLAGSFNNWLNKEIFLKKNDSVWQTTIHLMPGKYYYKYIVDDQWIIDPHNLQTEFDGVNAENSVLYVTNHVFRLDSTEDLSKVVVSGSFNDWDTIATEMQAVDSGFELPVYLAKGCHLYRFWSMGTGFPDPDNPKQEQTAEGYTVSKLCVGDPVVFRLEGFENADNVYLAGSFNQWRPEDIRMNWADSAWEATVYLTPGNYEYKFIADGQWMPDPNNPQTHGSGALVNSFYVHRPNHLFVLDNYADANEVFVTGSFNDWIHHGYKMHRKNNRWELELFLPKGKVSYKFIVDGKWITDPANPNYERNETGSHNSILWKE